MTDRDHERMTQPRYAGIPTFFRTRMSEGLDDVDIGLIGVPYDGAVTNRTGTRHGPREVRNQSSLIRVFHQITKISPYELARIADLGDVPIARPYALDEAMAAIGAFYRDVVGRGIVPVSTGGDHAIALAILRAVGKDRPVGMVHIDAHADTGDEYLGSRYHHGTPFRRAVEEGVLDPKRTCQIGIRGTVNDRELWKFSADSGMRLIDMEEVEDLGIPAVIAEARRVAGDGPVYVSFDIDSLDPVYAPGTGTPEAGGFTMREALRLVRGLRGLDVVGADMVEVSPPFDVGGLTAFHGATVLFELLCLAAEAFAARRA
ncbi:agmatinase [Marinivivus vitaminiproducens]|uniref:agmatinase n=1 Tax=Marinivivus vitaminiproducens TaxID=3035935 RepID=UPI002799F011|nr:agmatinase [Geminicoccaceae bacterium SCSIO 64248]